MTRQEDSSRAGAGLHLGPKPRPFRPEDADALSCLARRAFPPTQAIFVAPSTDGYVVDGADGSPPPSSFGFSTCPRAPAWASSHGR